MITPITAISAAPVAADLDPGRGALSSIEIDEPRPPPRLPRRRKLSISIARVRALETLDQRNARGSRQSSGARGQTGSNPVLALQPPPAVPGVDRPGWVSFCFAFLGEGSPDLPRSRHVLHSMRVFLCSLALSLSVSLAVPLRIHFSPHSPALSCLDTSPRIQHLPPGFLSLLYVSAFSFFFGFLHPPTIASFNCLLVDD